MLNVPRQQCAILMYPEDTEESGNQSQQVEDANTEKDENQVEEAQKDQGPLVPSQQQNVIQNQLHQASHLFTNARFVNCNFTFH